MCLSVLCLVVPGHGGQCADLEHLHDGDDAVLRDEERGLLRVLVEQLQDVVAALAHHPTHSAHAQRGREGQAG